VIIPGRKTSKKRWISIHHQRNRIKLVSKFFVCFSFHCCGTTTDHNQQRPRLPLPSPTPQLLPSRRQRLPVAHHVSPELFPPPPSLPPSTRLAYAKVHLRSDISSEPESSDPPSPTSCHAAAQLIHSPQPTNSQLPQILTQDVISALLGMPPSRTSSVAPSHRR